MLASRKALLFSAILALFAAPCVAQELEPWRWTHLPINTNFFGWGFGQTKADIFFDPVLQIEDATLDMRTLVIRYIRTFRLFDKTARFEFIQPWQDGKWSGLLNGAPASVNRKGWADTTVRFAINLLGAPPLEGKEFAAYRATNDVETHIGAALSVQLPTGQYYDDRLLNIGANRVTFKPQVGLVHSRGKWSLETTASAWIFTDNDSFFNNTTLEQDPLYTIQGSVVHTFSSGFWLSAGAAYGYGGESIVNGVRKENRIENVVWSISGGYPINRKLSIKVAYIGSQTQTPLGSDTGTFSLGLSTAW